MTLEGQPLVVEELDSWRAFAEALSPDDKDLFMEMLGSCRAYLPAMEARESPLPAEALFMGLLLAQHRAIVWLTREIDELKAGRREGLDT